MFEPRRTPSKLLVVSALTGAFALTMLSSGCGGSQESGVSEEDSIQAERLLSLSGMNMSGEWSRAGDDVLTTWVTWESDSEEGYYDAATGSYVVIACASVNLAHRIDNQEDVRLAVGVVSDSHCTEARPSPPSRPLLPTDSAADRKKAMRLFAHDGIEVGRNVPSGYFADTHPTAHDSRVWFAYDDVSELCWGANIDLNSVDIINTGDCLESSYR